MQNRLTIKDIARLSGVGKSTVSRVINNEEGVSESTRLKVLKVVQDQNFSPSKSARSMRGGSDKIVAIIVSRLDSPSENQSVRAMLPMLYQQGYDPIVLESQFCTDRVAEHLQVLERRNIDGLILFGFSGLDISMFTQWHHKMVMVARSMPGISSVEYDNAGAVELLMEQLIKRKIKNISYIGVEAEDATTGQQRSEAYINQCREHGLDVSIALGNLSHQSGFDLTSQVLKPDTQAVICATDTIALGVHKYLQLQGISAIQVCCVGSHPLLNFLFQTPYLYNRVIEIAEKWRLNNSSLSFWATPPPSACDFCDARFT